MTKAVTYDERPIMKRDTGEKSSLFLRKRNVTALIKAKINSDAMKLDRITTWCFCKQNALYYGFLGSVQLQAGS